MDEFDKFKQTLLAELTVQYKNLVSFLQTLPINQNFKSNGFQNLDQGLMWMEKGIAILQKEKSKEIYQGQEPFDDSIILNESSKIN